MNKNITQTLGENIFKYNLTQVMHIIINICSNGQNHKIDGHNKPYQKLSLYSKYIP